MILTVGHNQQFPSIQHAINYLIESLSSPILTETITIEVYEGFYGGFIVPNSSIFPTSSNRLIIKAKSSNKAVLSGLISSSNLGHGSNIVGIGIGDNTPNIDIVGLRIENFHKGIVIGGNSNRIGIYNNLLRQNINVGIWVYYADECSLFNNVVLDHINGIVLSNVNECNIVNNDIVNITDPPNSNSYNKFCLFIQGKHPNTSTPNGTISCYNNNIISNGGHCIGINDYGINRLRSNNNNLFNSNGNIASITNNNIGSLSLSSWVSYSNNDHSSISVICDHYIPKQIGSLLYTDINLNSFISYNGVGKGIPLCNTPLAASGISYSPLYVLPYYSDTSKLCETVQTNYGLNIEGNTNLNRPSIPSIGAFDINLDNSGFGSNLVTSIDSVYSASASCNGSFYSSINQLEEKFSSSISCITPLIKDGFFFINDAQYYLYANKTGMFCKDITWTKFNLAFYPNSNIQVIFNDKTLNKEDYIVTNQEIFVNNKNLYNLKELGNKITVVGETKEWLDNRFIYKTVHQVFNYEDGFPIYVLPSYPQNGAPIVVTDNTVTYSDNCDVLNSQFIIEENKIFGLPELKFNGSHNLIKNPQFDRSNPYLYTIDHSGSIIYAPQSWITSGNISAYVISKYESNFTGLITGYSSFTGRNIWVDVNGSDQFGDGTKENPYREPNKASSVANSGDIIYLNSGIHTGYLSITGDSILVKGIGNAMLCGLSPITGNWEQHSSTVWKLTGVPFHEPFALVIKPHSGTWLKGWKTDLISEIILESQFFYTGLTQTGLYLYATGNPTGVYSSIEYTHRGGATSVYNTLASGGLYVNSNNVVVDNVSSCGWSSNGLLVDNSSGLIVINSNFSYNNGDGAGGYAAKNPVADHCVFSWNGWRRARTVGEISADGDGISWHSGGTVESTDIIVRDSYFEGNTKDAWQHINRSTALMERCIIKNCNFGVIFNTEGGSQTMRNCTLFATPYDIGGVGRLGAGDIKVQNCTFVGSFAASIPAVNIINGELQVQNCIFTDWDYGVANLFGTLTESYNCWGGNNVINITINSTSNSGDPFLGNSSQLFMTLSTGSTAAYVGVALTGFSEDLLKRTRSSPWSMGAIEPMTDFASSYYASNINYDQNSNTGCLDIYPVIGQYACVINGGLYSNQSGNSTGRIYQIVPIDSLNNYWLSFYVATPKSCNEVVSSKTGNLELSWSFLDFDYVPINRLDSDTMTGHYLVRSVSSFNDNKEIWKRHAIAFGRLDTTVGKTDPNVNLINSMLTNPIPIPSGAGYINIGFASSGLSLIDAVYLNEGFDLSDYRKTYIDDDFTIEYENGVNNFFSLDSLSISNARNPNTNGFLYIGALPARQFDENAPLNATTLSDWYWPTGRTNYLPWAKLSGKNKLQNKATFSNRESVYNDITITPLVPTPNEISTFPRIPVSSIKYGVGPFEQINTSNNDPSPGIKGTDISITVTDQDNNPYAFESITAVLSNDINGSLGSTFLGYLGVKELGFYSQYGQKVTTKLDSAGSAVVRWIPPSWEFSSITINDYRDIKIDSINGKKYYYIDDLPFRVNPSSIDNIFISSPSNPNGYSVVKDETIYTEVLSPVGSLDRYNRYYSPSFNPSNNYCKVFVNHTGNINTTGTYTDLFNGYDLPLVKSNIPEITNGQYFIDKDKCLVLASYNGPSISNSDKIKIVYKPLRVYLNCDSNGVVDQRRLYFTEEFYNILKSEVSDSNPITINYDIVINMMIKAHSPTGMTPVYSEINTSTGNIIVNSNEKFSYISLIGKSSSYGY